MTQELKYEVIEGTISDLQVQAANVHFLKRIKQEQQLASVAAIGQALAGQAGAVLSAQAATDEGDPVESFYMNIAGFRAEGSFWKATFSNGDDVKVVGRKQNKTFYATAVVETTERIVWIQPHSERGTRSQGRTVLKRAIIATCILSALAPLMSWYLEEPLWLSGATVACAAALMWGVMVVWSWRDFMDFSREMNAVASALGWPDPAEIDLFKTTRQARKAGKPELPMGVYYF